MTRIIAVVALVFLSALSSCQCSDKPEVGPVEDASVRVDV